MTTRRFVLTLLAATLAASPALAQATPRAERPARPDRPERVGPAPETVLRLREQLGLSADQVTRLETIRRQNLDARRARMAERMDIRSRVQAGSLTREEARLMVAERMGAAAGSATEVRDRVNGVLTEAQRERVTNLRRGAMMMQRGQAMRGRGHGALGQRRPGVVGPRGDRMRPDRSRMRPGTRGELRRPMRPMRPAPPAPPQTP